MTGTTTMWHSPRVSAYAAVPPSGVVTFLFTDVEGSTRRWEADAQTMRAVLAAHDEVLRRAIGEHHGYLFKHTGDGVCAAFASPKSAVEAAVAAQRELELPVRMGIATGEAELRDSDYFGTALNRAARLMSAGHGGQVLVADSTARLLAGVDLVDLGQHQLRDVPGPIGVFQVHAPGLRSEFPPLRTPTRRVGNVRPPVSSFVGREPELVKVADEVRLHRLVTLTGVGGVGKTRLAVEVARRLSDEFPDGIWLLELASVSDPDAVPDAVAAVLGVTQQPGASLAESIAEAMEGKTQLLVFDNCEHLRDAAAELIDTILVRSTALRILATSREGLTIADEHLRVVPSLDVDDGVGSAAVDLFADRARAVVADFELSDPDEASAAVEICRRLDGIPLAIELAASRMASMTASEVRDRLDQRFRLLVGSRRGLERHQTLRHTVAWSYDLLDPAEKQLLQNCSVFAGGFDLSGACAVAASGHSDEFEVLDLLSALVRKSLVVAHRSAGRTRYSMLETIRQFAEDRLVADGAAAEIRTAHAAYFASREVDLEAMWNSPRQREAYEWFSTELPNLRAAFRWAADEFQVEPAAKIVTYAAFLGGAVENLEAIAWAEELIQSAAAVDHPRLAVLQTLASNCWMPGRLEDAVRYTDDALRTLGSRPLAEMPFGIDGQLGSGYITFGQPERAVECYRQQLECGTDAKGLKRVGLALALMALGDLESALSTVEVVIDDPVLTRNPYIKSFAALAYSSALINTQPVKALEVLRHALVTAQESGNRAIATFLTTNMSRVMAHHGDPVKALDQLTVVIRHYLDGGNLSNLRSSFAIVISILDHMGRHVAAATVAGFAVNPFILAAIPETQLALTHARESLGDVQFEALHRTGAAMTTPAMVEFVENEIADLRAELTAT